MPDRDKGEIQREHLSREQRGVPTQGASGATGHPAGGDVPDTVGTGGPDGNLDGTGAGISNTGGGEARNAGNSPTGGGTSGTT